MIKYNVRFIEFINFEDTTFSKTGKRNNYFFFFCVIDCVIGFKQEIKKFLETTRNLKPFLFLFGRETKRKNDKRKDSPVSPGLERFSVEAIKTLKYIFFLNLQQFQCGLPCPLKKKYI